MKYEQVRQVQDRVQRSQLLMGHGLYQQFLVDLLVFELFHLNHLTDITHDDHRAISFSVALLLDFDLN